MDEDLRTLDVLATAVASGKLADAHATELLHALTRPLMRDAILAAAVGRLDDARALASGRRVDARWLTAGPLDPSAIEAARPVVAQLEAAALGAGEQYQWPVTTILGYLDWATGRTLAAATRLRRVPPSYAMATMLKEAIAHPFIPAPRLLALVGSPR